MGVLVGTVAAEGGTIIAAVIAGVFTTANTLLTVYLMRRSDRRRERERERRRRRRP